MVKLLKYGMYIKCIIMFIICCLYSNCLKLHIFHGTIPDGKPHRLVWCPNISQQSDDDDDDNLVLAVSSGSRVYCIIL